MKSSTIAVECEPSSHSHLECLRRSGLLLQLLLLLPLLLQQELRIEQLPLQLLDLALFLADDVLRQFVVVHLAGGGDLVDGHLGVRGMRRARLRIAVRNVDADWRLTDLRHRRWNAGVCRKTIDKFSTKDTSENSW